MEISQSFNELSFWGQLKKFLKTPFSNHTLIARSVAVTRHDQTIHTIQSIEKPSVTFNSTDMMKNKMDVMTGGFDCVEEKTTSFQH